ncbi:hypothetical protein Ddc_05788 [Ditylenchus destructor]|nr:hypothetical protein Ddc_05788 [Ditylenchus destructor]
MRTSVNDIESDGKRKSAWSPVSIIYKHNLTVSCLFVMLYCVPFPSSSATTSSDAFTDFHCSHTGFSSGGAAWTSSQEMRTRFSHSPAATAILKSILRKQYSETDLKAVISDQSSSSLFMRQCSCQHDWMSAFCLRAQHYAKMEPIDAPTVCICRQRISDEEERSCTQFLTRCFPTSPHRSKSMLNNRPVESCSCCFNQPDDYCNQVDCRRMHPNFGDNNMTSCVCYSHANYPHHICSRPPPVLHPIPPANLFPEDWAQLAVTPIERVIAVTSRPTTTELSKGTSVGAKTAWLTPQKLGLFVMIATVVGAVLCFVGFRIVLATRAKSKRRRKAKSDAGDPPKPEAGHLQESNELNHFEDGTETNHSNPESTMHFV